MEKVGQRLLSRLRRSGRFGRDMTGVVRFPLPGWNVEKSKPDFPGGQIWRRVGVKEKTSHQPDSPMEEEKSQPELKDWERENFEPGGGDAFLFYVVFGRVDIDAPISRTRFRSEGIPEGLEVKSHGPDHNPEVPGSFRKGYLWKKLRSDEPLLAKTIAAQDSCVVLRGIFPDPPNLNYLRDTVGLITHFLGNGGVAVFDPQIFKWWEPNEWRERIFDTNGPKPRRHARVLVAKDDNDTEWIHTRGMRKFGRPDLSIRRVEEPLKEGFIELCHRFINLQASGGIIPNGKKVRMSSLPSGYTCHHAGRLDDPEFNNVHVRIGKTWRSKRKDEEEGGE